MKLRVSKKYALLYLLLAVLIYETIIKYSGVSWTPTVYSNVVSMQGKTIPMLKYVAFILILLLCLTKGIYKKNIYTLSGFLLILTGIIWCLFSLDSGLALIYLDTPPVLLIELGCLFLVLQAYKTREKLRNICGFLAVFFTVFTLLDLLSFLSEFSLIRMANGNVIEHFANALFLLAVWNCFIDRKSKKVFLLYGCSICLIIISVFMTSRGWMIQAVILMASVYLSNSSRDILGKIKRIALVICMFIVVYIIITRYMNDAFSYLMNRMGQNTRSFQLIVFFNQVSSFKLIIGQGPNATYLLNGTNYAYVDNIYLFWMFRYGVISVIAYWIPFLYGLFAKNNNRYLNSKFQYNIMIIMWIMAMGGLCIYYNIRLDVANIFLLAAIIEYIELKKQMDTSEFK